MASAPPVFYEILHLLPSTAVHRISSDRFSIFHALAKGEDIRLRPAFGNVVSHHTLKRFSHFINGTYLAWRKLPTNDAFLGTTSCSTAPTTSPRATSSVTPCTPPRHPSSGGSVFRFDGQVSVWWAGEGALLRLRVPLATGAECRAVVCRRRRPRGGVHPGVGSVMGTEAVKAHHRDGRAPRRTPARARRPRADSDALPVATDPGCRVCGSRRGRGAPARVGDRHPD